MTTLKYTLLQKLEEQTFDKRFFSLVRILGIWVLLGETSTSHNTRFLTKQEHLFHMATPKISSILSRLKNLMSKVCSSNFFGVLYIEPVRGKVMVYFKMIFDD